MQRYRGNSGVVDAVPWDGRNLEEVARWARVVGCPDRIQYTGHDVFGDSLAVPTREGLLGIGVGDYIIKGADGELSACSSEVFLDTYEAVLG